MSAPANERFTVTLQGFSAFERTALASFFRLAAQRTPSYVQVDAIDRCDFIIADADHAASMKAVQSAGRVADTVFVGARAPQGAMAWLARPIDPMHIVRELDSLVDQRQTAPSVLGPPIEPAGVAGFGSSTLGAFAGHDDEAGPDVLVVEDSAIARRFLQVRLQRLGYHVHIAHDAEEALALLRHQRFLMVFLDVVLGAEGNLDGLQVCQQLKHDPAYAAARNPKVVMVTGLAGAMDKVRGELAGCDAYLTKPLLEAEFVKTLQQLDPGLRFRSVAG